jgi:ABC-type multidrug transport system fused ATPase/permease subunit
MSLLPGRFRGNGALVAPTRRLLRGVESRFALLIATSMLVGLGQAIVLAIVVHVALHLADSTLIESGSDGILGLLPSDPNALIAIGFAAIVGVFFVETFNAFLQARIGARVLDRLRTRLYAAYADAEVEAQSSLRPGQLAQLLTVNGAWAGSATLSSTAAAVAISTFITLGVIAAALSPLPTLAMIIAVAGVFAVIRPIVGRTRGASREMADRNTDLTETTGLAVELAEVIRTTGVADDYTASVRSTIGDMSHYWGRVRFFSRVGPAMFRNAALLLTFGAIAVVYAIDISSVATLGATMLILIRSLTYMQAFQNGLQELHSNLPWLEEIWKVTDELEARPVDRSGEPLAGFGAIELHGVGLTYPNGTTALRDGTTRIEPGDVVGVIGPSGAGKSSFAQLLLRLRQPTTGQITIGGQDLADVALDDWTGRVGFVPQEPRLLPNTIAANIAFFRSVGPAEIEAAARAAGVHDEIVSLPDGYETELRGDTRLSGGQRQRLALARALVTRPQLLVLDEPTSALDMRTEAGVADAIAALRGETTVVIIAHRLSSLVHCDRLIVVEDGRITANEVPHQLEQTNAFYREALVLASAEAR